MKGKRKLGTSVTITHPKKIADLSPDYMPSYSFCFTPRGMAVNRRNLYIISSRYREKTRSAERQAMVSLVSGSSQYHLAQKGLWRQMKNEQKFRHSN